jgi:hypothetical protein
MPPPAQGPAEPPGFLQPKYLIALGICAALILLAGIAVVLFNDGDGSVTTKPGTTLSNSLPTTTRVLTTTPILLPTTTLVTTTTTTTSTTSTTTTTTTPAPIAAVANAGDDLAVDVGQIVNLAALDLSEQNQSVVWRQVAGPDVTDGRERLVGAAAVFTAPPRPTTLRFEVSVTGRGGDVATDDLRVDVYEQADRALFVDGVDGSGSGDGTRQRPYRDLAAAVAEAEARGNGTDLYIRTADTSYTVAAEIRTGSSLYGGYDADWVRIDGRRTQIAGRLSYVGRSSFALASIDLRGSDDADGPVLGVSFARSFLLEDSIVRARNSATGNNIAVVIEDVSAADIVRSEIIGGRAGRGDDAPVAGPPETPLVAGVDGNAAVGSAPGAAHADLPATAGGAGGEGPVTGDDGGAGAPGGAPGEDGAPGLGGDGGDPGTSGSGGVGVGSDGLVGAPGAPGLAGAPGRPGEGAGGGGGRVAHDGGGGGGGGTGGMGGVAGLGGKGGRASVALLARAVERLTVSGSTVRGGTAGQGGAGGAPLDGSHGGSGGQGAPGVTSLLDTAGSGGHGGGGGAGGQGGWGGGGAGGPSIGLMTVDVGSAIVADSRIMGGDGGIGGAGGFPSAAGANGVTGGAGGIGTGDLRGERAAQSSGGDSIGWRDDSDTTREITESRITAGTPGRPGGEGGATGRAIDQAF